MFPYDEVWRRVPLPEDDFETDKMWKSVNEMRRTEEPTLIYIANERQQPLITDHDYMKIVNWCCKATLQIWYSRGGELEPAERRSQEECRRTVRSIDNALNAIRLTEIGAEIGMKYRNFRLELGLRNNQTEQPA